jgi:hypothetical protein
MGWFILAQMFTILIAIVSLGRLSKREKDLEILVLRQQLAILKRKQGQPVKPNRAEKMILAVLATCFIRRILLATGSSGCIIRP